MNLHRAVLFCLVCWLTAAAAGPYPVPLSITKTEGVVPKLRVNWTIIDIPETDAPAPVGFWFGSAKSIGSNFPVVQSEACVSDICGTKVIPGESISSTAMRAFYKGPTTTIYGGGGGANGYCISFGGIPEGNPTYAAALLPTGCMKEPPSNVYCFIVTPEINLNHGKISLKDVSSSLSSALVNINCSQNTNVKLSLNTKLTYVQLNNNAKANIRINDKLPGEKHAIPTGLSVLTISSQLEGITQGGVYSGTAVLIIEPA
jgi:hypothetical protein